jgi:hypothetical protein
VLKPTGRARAQRWNKHHEHGTEEGAQPTTCPPSSLTRVDDVAEDSGRYALPQLEEALVTNNA